VKLIVTVTDFSRDFRWQHAYCLGLAPARKPRQRPAKKTDDDERDERAE
jgi:hypothetical protein